MADIRQSTGVLDDFDSYDPGELLFGEAAPELWGLTGFGFWADNETAGSLGDGWVTHEAGHSSSMTYWKGFSMDGNDCEVWATAIGGGDVSGIAWAIGLVQQFTLNAVDGYRFRWESVGDAWRLYRVDNTVSTQLDSDNTGIPASGAMMLIRRNGGSVEGWVSATSAGVPDPTSWTMVVSAADSTYTTGLYGAIGVTSNFAGQQLGWDNFGAGVEAEWHPEFIRRPWRYKGRHLTPNA